MSNETKKSNDGHKIFQYRCNICKQVVWLREINANRTITCTHKTRNMTNKRLKKILSSMYERCYNKKNKSYKNYGGKGIKICEEWLDGKNFENWAMKNGYRDDLTIDRIYVNGNYEPSNCRWITLAENSRFKSTTNYICVNNIIHSGKEWSKILNKGMNFINRYKRKYGLKATIEYIKNNLN